MQSHHKRLGALFALAAIATVSSASVAAPPDPAPPQNPAAADTDAPKVRPAVHHVAMSNAQRDAALLQAELQRLRAEAAMCRDGVGRRADADR